MEKRTRRKFTSEYKTKVVIEALKERQSLEELSKKYELHPNQIGIWKKEFLSKAANVFDGDSAKEDQEAVEKEKEKLYAQIGRLQYENSWLKKKLQ